VGRNARPFQKIQDLIIPKKEVDDNTPDSPQDKLMQKMLSNQMRENEIPLPEDSDIEGESNDEGYYNTRKLIDEGKIGSGTVRQLYKKIKKSDPT